MTTTQDTAATELLPLPELIEWLKHRRDYARSEAEWLNLHNARLATCMLWELEAKHYSQLIELLANMNRRAESELQEAFASFVAKELSGRVLESGISIIDAATLAFSAGANWQAAWNRRAAPSANGMTDEEISSIWDDTCGRLGRVDLAEHLMAFAREIEARAIARHLSDKGQK